MDYLKGKKTKITSAIKSGLIATQHNPDLGGIDLFIHKGNNLNVVKAICFSGKYIDLYKLNRQIAKLVKEGHECIYIKYPHEFYNFNLIKIFNTKTWNT